MMPFSYNRQWPFDGDDDDESTFFDHRLYPFPPYSSSSWPSMIPSSSLSDLPSNLSSSLPLHQHFFSSNPIGLRRGGSVQPRKVSQINQRPSSSLLLSPSSLVSSFHPFSFGNDSDHVHRSLHSRRSTEHEDREIEDDRGGDDEEDPDSWSMETGLSFHQADNDPRREIRGSSSGRRKRSIHLDETADTNLRYKEQHQKRLQRGRRTLTRRTRDIKITPTTNGRYDRDESMSISSMGLPASLERNNNRNGVDTRSSSWYQPNFRHREVKSENNRDFYHYDDEKSTPRTVQSYTGPIPTHLQSKINHYFDYIQNVPSDGHCGYHALMEGLRQYNLLPSNIDSVAKFRYAIRQYAIQHETELLGLSGNGGDYRKGSDEVKFGRNNINNNENCFTGRGGIWNFRNDDEMKSRARRQFWKDINGIYDETKVKQYNTKTTSCGGNYYDHPVLSDDWINSYVVFPLVSQMFGVNIWVLSVHGDDDNGNGNIGSNSDLARPEYTTIFRYDPKIDGVRSTRHDHNLVWFPQPSSSSQEEHHDTVASLGCPTIHLLHVNRNHYVRGVTSS